jgi:hypothetical protein
MNRLIAQTLSGVALAILGLAAPALAQTPPRTADGHPDLSGMWDADFITPLERPDGVVDLVVKPEQAADVLKKMQHTPKGAYDPDIDYFKPEALLVVRGEARSSWLVEPRDGKMPYTALARAAGDRAFEMWGKSYDNPEERPPSERCISSLGHPPLTGISKVIPNHFIQTPDAVLVTTEDTDSTRIIHLGGAAPPDVVRTRAGYSAGRWEGDTLVVETTHFAASDPSGLSFHDAVVTGEGSRVVERFTLLSDRELLYPFTVIDRTLYAATWLAEYVLKRLDEPVYEYACHEGNHGMRNILLAGRMGKQKEPPKPKAKKPDPAKPAADADKK